MGLLQPPPFLPQRSDCPSVHAQLSGYLPNAPPLPGQPPISTYLSKPIICSPPFLLPGGCVILHDSIDPASGPYRVVQEALGRGDFTLLEKAGKNTVLQKWSGSSASASTGEEERK